MLLTCSLRHVNVTVWKFDAPLKFEDGMLCRRHTRCPSHVLRTLQMCFACSSPIAFRLWTVRREVLLLQQRRLQTRKRAVNSTTIAARIAGCRSRVCVMTAATRSANSVCSCLSWSEIGRALDMASTLVRTMVLRSRNVLRRLGAQAQSEENEMYKLWPLCGHCFLQRAA